MAAGEAEQCLLTVQCLNICVLIGLWKQVWYAKTFHQSDCFVLAPFAYNYRSFFLLANAAGVSPDSSVRPYKEE